MLTFIFLSCPSGHSPLLLMILDIRLIVIIFIKKSGEIVDAVCPLVGAE